MRSLELSKNDLVSIFGFIVGLIGSLLGISMVYSNVGIHWMILIFLPFLFFALYLFPIRYLLEYMMLKGSTYIIQGGTLMIISKKKKREFYLQSSILYINRKSAFAVIEKQGVVYKPSKYVRSPFNTNIHTNRMISIEVNSLIKYLDFHDLKYRLVK